MKSSHSDRVLGCLLGGACGDVLGASVEGWDAEKIQRRYPDGLKDFQQTDRGFGCYTDDTNMAIALAVSLVRKGRCDAEDCAAEYARMFQPRRGYGGTALKILQALRNGADYKTTGTMLFKQGSYANGGAMRIAPLGLAYRHADVAVLHTAVVAALLCTHVHPEGIDGAFIQAAGVAWLCKAHPETFAATSLLSHLLQLAKTDTLRDKLLVLQQRLQEKGHLPDQGIDSTLGEHLKSSSWQWTRQVASLVSEPFQIKATDAVAVSLLVFLLHWRQPEKAIMCAVHLGGDTDTLATIVGSMCGALHGAKWIPSRWHDTLENEEYGRDMLYRLAEELAEVDVGSTATEGRATA